MKEYDELKKELEKTNNSMWTIIKIDKKKLNIFKEDLTKKLKDKIFNFIAQN